MKPKPEGEKRKSQAISIQKNLLKEGQDYAVAMGYRSFSHLIESLLAKELSSAEKFAHKLKGHKTKVNQAIEKLKGKY